MEEIFDREHDDEYTYDASYVVPHRNNNVSENFRCCTYCGGNIPPMVVVCPQCGKWWTNSES